jgi:hypothetical protein
MSVPRDHLFAGYRAKGDAEALQRLGAQYGMQVDIVDLLSDFDSVPPSSSSSTTSSSSFSGLSSLSSTSRDSSNASTGSSGASNSLGLRSADRAGSSGTSTDGEGAPTLISSSKVRAGR